jgi:hypothetical protein
VVSWHRSSIRVREHCACFRAAPFARAPWSVVAKRNLIEVGIQWQLIVSWLFLHPFDLCAVFSFLTIKQAYRKSKGQDNSCVLFGILLVMCC